MGEGGGGFPATRWESLLGAARGEEKQVHLEELFALYWKPVYFYIRREWGKTNDEAKDLTQSFFVRLIETDFLRGIDPDRGRFRTYVKACLRNFLLDDRKYQRAQKRGGGALHLSLDDPDLALDVPDGDAEEVFDAAWLQAILESALAELSETLNADGREIEVRLLREVDVDPLPGESPSYAELAERHGMTVQAVKSGLDHARRSLRRLVESRVRDSCRTDEDAAREMEELFGA